MQFTNGYALVIGVDEYISASSSEVYLPVARNDAVALAEVLTNEKAAGYPDRQVTVLTGRNANRITIAKEFEKLQSIAPSDSTVLIFLCGYGIVRGQEYYFVASDAAPELNESSLLSSAIAGQELAQRISSLQAQRVVMMFDTGLLSSWSDTSQEKVQLPPLFGDESLPPPDFVLDNLRATGEGRVIISACGPGQHSYFDQSSGRSFFSQALVEGLSGNSAIKPDQGYITVNNLWRFVSKRVGSLARQFSATLKQVPSITASTLDPFFPVALFHGGEGIVPDGSSASKVEQIQIEQSSPTDDSEAKDLRPLDSAVKQSQPRRKSGSRRRGAASKDSDTPSTAVSADTDATTDETSPAPTTRPASWLPIINADTANAGLTQGQPLTDLLDITPDVRAFATLIASKRLAPPLSIGLFGEWGSGKTFFMQLLKEEIEKRARAARDSGKPQSQVMFYKNIRQIEFNAWQYMEGDLWASLVSHIFDGLVNNDRASNEEQIEEWKKERLTRLDRLGVQKAAEEAARVKQEQAQVALSAAQAEQDQAQRELRNAETKALEITPRNILEKAFGQANVQDGLTALRAKLGLDPDLGDDIEKTFSETEAAYNRSQTLAGSLLGGGNRIWWLLLIPAISVLAGVIAGLLTWAAGSEWFAQTAAVITSIGGLIAGAIAWLRKQIGWASGWLADVEKLRDDLEANIKAQTEPERTELAEREADVEAARKRLAEAQEARAKAQQQVAQAEEDLRNASPEKLLTSFLEERVESSDYRKRLGILALIRQDFQTLSNLMSEGNKDLEDVTDLKKEQENDTGRINRIVLYIDDLDRCPPENVVKVLQAVNLLLGLPLFVVVVAVDARWVRGSLLSRYKGLLQDELITPNMNSGANDEQASIQDLQASPLDYLEKIFQIPFWLSPISEDGRKTMLKDLLAPTPAAIRPETPPTNGNSDKPLPENKADESTPGANGPTAVVNIARDGNGPEATNGAGQPIPEPAQAPRPPEQADSKEEEVDMNPAAMTIQKTELDFVEELAPLLGRSPRALKRFVNTYMLVKAKLGDVGILLGEANDTQYKIILVLVALVTHSPEVTPLVFQAVDYNAGLQSAPASATWKSIQSYVVAQSKENKRSPDWEAEWKRVSDWLDKHETELQTDWKNLNIWVQRIARYAYVADPSWLS